MPQNQKPAEPGDYECIWCDTVFTYNPEQGVLECPNCHHQDRKDLVPIYMQDNPAEDNMYTSGEFHGA